MRLHTKLSPYLLCLAMLLAGCVNPMNPERTITACSRAPFASEEPSYREKAMEFIRYAQAGDVEQMLRITSPLTHATQVDSMRTLYATQVVPQFQGTTVTWYSRSIPILDENNNGGLTFTGTARGKKKFSFDIAVYRENGTLVVANIRKHHWYSTY